MFAHTHALTHALTHTHTLHSVCLKQLSAKTLHTFIRVARRYKPSERSPLTDTRRPADTERREGGHGTRQGAGDPGHPGLWLGSVGGQIMV